MSVITDTVNADFDTRDLTAILDTASVLSSILTAFDNQPRFSSGAAGTWLAELLDQIEADIRTAEATLMKRELDENSVSTLANAGKFYLESTDAGLIGAVLRQAYRRLPHRSTEVTS